MSYTPLAPRHTSGLMPGLLGAAGLVAFGLSAAAPMASTAAGTTAGWAITRLLPIPLAFLVAMAIYLVFIPGYAAMSRHVDSPGAIYTFVARGLGRIGGTGAAFTALACYTAMQLALYGGIGAVAAQYLNPIIGPIDGVFTLPWWAYSGLAWLLVGLGGRLRVDYTSKILGTAMAAECALMLLFDAIMLAHPHHGHLSWSAVSPAGLTNPALAVGVVIAFTSFGGIEDTVTYRVETSPTSIGRALRASVIAGGLVYAVSGWAMAAAAGDDQIVTQASSQHTELMFTLVAPYVSSAAITTGHLLLLTSLTGSLAAFHTSTARYLYALGHHGVLPGWLGRTSRRNGAPKNASMTLSATAAVAIAVVAIAGWDPLVNLFFWLGTLSGLGIVLLLALASMAVIGYFARDRHGEPAHRRLVLPAISVLLLAGVVIGTLIKYPVLLGVPSTHPAVWILPSTLAAAFVAGIGRAVWLYARRPDAFHRIGFGTPQGVTTIPLTTEPA